ncbi:hypothetical protein SAMN05661093_03649 [Kibdelosporangium aridum]|uniref:Uncharacterized protein n=1 Tax=Kibdelosporangium aridum TaxID=2030 RepID=A0A1W2DNZ0_KIBAR|nr:hypothetical protein SAMN05661093_03649 [Kibdelosporangium aridum]
MLDQRDDHAFLLIGLVPLKLCPRCTTLRDGVITLHLRLIHRKDQDRRARVNDQNESHSNLARDRARHCPESGATCQPTRLARGRRRISLGLRRARGPLQGWAERRQEWIGPEAIDHSSGCAIPPPITWVPTWNSTAAAPNDGYFLAIPADNASAAAVHWNGAPNPWCGLTCPLAQPFRCFVDVPGRTTPFVFEHAFDRQSLGLALASRATRAGEPAVGRHVPTQHVFGHGHTGAACCS